MTAPVPPDRPARLRLRTITPAIVGVVAILTTIGVFARRSPPTPIGLCTMQNPGDSVATEYAHVLGTDSLYVMDSVAWAHVDSASLPAMLIEPKCDVVKHPVGARRSR